MEVHSPIGDATWATHRQANLGVQGEARRPKEGAPVRARLHAATRRRLRPDVLRSHARRLPPPPQRNRRQVGPTHASLGLCRRVPPGRVGAGRSGLLHAATRVRHRGGRRSRPTGPHRRGRRRRPPLPGRQASVRDGSGRAPVAAFPVPMAKGLERERRIRRTAPVPKRL